MALSIQVPARRASSIRAFREPFVRLLRRLRAAASGWSPTFDPLRLPDYWLRDIGMEEEARVRQAAEAERDWARLDRW